MGDRRMAEIRVEDGSLYIYSHWHGFEMPGVAKAAIVTARSRWDDESYATHIIVDQMTKAGRDSETGTGIMLKPNAEDQYNSGQPSVIIDLTSKTLTIIDGSNEYESIRFENIEKRGELDG